MEACFLTPLKLTQDFSKFQGVREEYINCKGSKWSFLAIEPWYSFATLTILVK